MDNFIEMIANMAVMKKCSMNMNKIIEEIESKKIKKTRNRPKWKQKYLELEIKYLDMKSKLMDRDKLLNGLLAYSLENINKDLPLEEYEKDCPGGCGYIKGGCKCNSCPKCDKLKEKLFESWDGDGML